MPSGRLLWPERARIVPSPRTIAPRLRQRAAPYVPFLFLMRVLGRRSPWCVLACCCATPLRSAAVLLAMPSLCNGTSRWCRWRVVPRATTSSRQQRLRVSVHLARGPLPDPCHGQRCWSSLSLLLLCTPAPMGILSRPRPPPHCTLLDDGQQSQVGGHTGRCVMSRESGNLRRRNRSKGKG